jgi:fibronectin-binding autotransporter adhesin
MSKTNFSKSCRRNALAHHERPRASRRKLLAAVVVGLSAGKLYATDIGYTWEGNGSTVGGGGSWTKSAKDWLNGGTTSSWANSSSSDAWFTGTAGTVSMSSAKVAGNVYFNTTGYTLTADSSDSTSGSGDFTLTASTINLTGTLNLAAVGSNADTVAAITGNITGGTLNLQGAPGNNNYFEVQPGGANTTISSALSITGTDSSGNGLIGFAAANGNITFSGGISNSSGNDLVELGATSGDTLTVNTTGISGTGGVFIGAASSGSGSAPGGGAGSVDLNVASSYSGGTTFAMSSSGNGTLVLGAASALPSGTLFTFAGGLGGALNLSGYNVTFGGLVSNTSSVGKIENNATGTSSTITINGASSSTYTYALPIVDHTSGTGTVALVINQGSNQTTKLTGVNTFSGGTTISAGTLALGLASDTLSSSGAVTVAGGTLDLLTNNETVGAVTLSGGNINSTGATGSQGTLTGTSYSLTGSGTVNAILAGSSVALTDSGTGTTTLNNASTYTGSTTISGSGGTLALGSGGSINSSPTIGIGANSTFDVHAVSGGYSLANGQTIRGTGTVNGGMTVASGSTLAPGTSNALGTLNTGDLTLNGGGNYNWRLYDATGSAGTGYDSLGVTGTLNVAATSGNKFNIDLWTVNSSGASASAIDFKDAQAQQWVLATTNNTITNFNAADFTINTGATNGTGGFANGLGGGTFSVVVSGDNLDLDFTPGLTNLYWNPASTTSTMGNWVSTPPGTGGTGIWIQTDPSWNTQAQPQTANFAGTAGAVTVDAGGVTATNGIEFSTTGYTVTGGTITLSSTGTNNVITTDSNVTATLSSALSTGAGITKAGLGTLIFNTAQGYTGGTTVNGGTLQLGDGTNNGSVALNITDNSVVAFANGTSLIYGNVISGGGSVVVSGPGTLSLSGQNSYSSGTTVSGGTLALGASNTLPTTGAITVNGGTLDLAGNTQTAGAVTVSSSGMAIISSVAGGTLTGSSYVVNNGNSPTPATVSAVLAGTGSALTKSGAGMLVLSNANTYTGGTTINGGTVSISADNNLGSGNITLGGGTLQTTATFAASSKTIALTSGTSSFFDAYGQNNTYGAISGSGGLTVEDTSGGGGGNLTTSAAYTQTTGSLTIGSQANFTLGGPAGSTSTFTGATITGNLIVSTATAGRVNFNTGTFAGAGAIDIQPLTGSAITNTSGTAGGTENVNIVLNSTNTTGAGFTKGDVTQSTYALGNAITSIGGTSSGQTLTIGGVISGYSDLNIGNSATGGGGGNLVLNAVNTYQGTTTINTAGNVLIGVDNALPSGTDVIFGTLSTIGASTHLDLNGHNLAVGSLSSGTNAGSANGITNGGTSDSILTVQGSTTPANAFKGILSDGATNKLSLVKAGSNTLTLTATNTYSGSTTINGGTLALSTTSTNNNNIAKSPTITIGASGTLNVAGVTGTGGFTLASGQTLQGTGTVSGGMTVGSGSTIAPGTSGTPGTLNTGNITLGGSGSYNWQIADANGSPGTGYDTLNATGALTIAATPSSKFTINLGTLNSGSAGNAANFDNTQSYEWVLAATNSPISAVNPSDFTINTGSSDGAGGFSNGLGGGTFSVVASGDNLDLDFTAPVVPLYWSGTGTDKNNWGFTASGSGGNGIWADADPSWHPSDGAVFAGTAGTVTVTSVTVNNGMEFSTTGYTVRGGTITLSSTGSNNVITTDTGVTSTLNSALSTNAGITKAGLGTLIFNSSQSYTGGTTVNGGTLQLGDGVSNIGAVAENITDNAAVAFANPSSQTFGNVISGAGSVVVSGPGTLTLSGANSYSAGTTVSGGTLALGTSNTLPTTGAIAVNGGILDLQTNSQSAGAVTLSSGSIVSTGATGSQGTLTGSSYAVNNGSGTAAISAILAGTGSALTKSGAGILVLSNANTYTGGTTINGGTVSISADNSLGNGNITLGNGTLQTTATFASASTKTITLTNGTSSFYDADGTNNTYGTISGTGGLTVEDSSMGGGGNLTTNAVYTQSTGSLTIGSNANFTLANSGTSTVTTATISGDLNLTNGATLSITGAVSGGGTIQTQGTAPTSIDGKSTTASIASGTNILLNSTTNIDATTGNTLTINGSISGSGGVNFETGAGTGGGLVVLANTSSYSGATLINNNPTGGIIRLGINNALPTATALTFGSATTAAGSLDLAGYSQQIGYLASNTTNSSPGSVTNTGGSTSTLTINGSATTAFAGVIGTTSNVTGSNNNIALVLASGNTGLLTLSGANTFTGGTTVNGGSLVAGVSNVATTSGAFGPSTVAVTLGAGSGSANASLLTGGAFTVSNPITVAAGSSGNTLSIGGNVDSSSAFSGPITMNNNLTVTQVTTTGNHTLSITGGITSGNASSNSLTFNNAGAVSVGTTGISDGGGGTLSVTQSGAGNTTLSAADGYSGGTTVNAGDLSIGAVTALPTTGAVLVSNGGDLTLNTAGTFGGTSQSLTLNPNQTSSPALNILSGATAVWQGTVALNANSLIQTSGVAGSLTLSSNISGPGTLIKSGAGNLILSGTGNSATGGTQINNGTVTVSSGSLLGTGSVMLSQTSTNNTALTFNNAAQTIGNLSSAFAATTGTQTQTVTLNGTALDIIQSGNTTFGNNGAVSTLTSTIGGTGSVTVDQNSTGALTLSGVNTYSGPTTINGGTLLLATSATTNNIAKSTAINVGSGATLDVTGVTATGGFALASGQTLAGTGTVNGALTLAAGTKNGSAGVLADGAILAPGANAATTGTLSTGSQTWNGQANLVAKVASVSGAGGTPVAGTDNDQVAMNGTLTLASTVTSTAGFNVQVNAPTGATSVPGFDATDPYTTYTFQLATFSAFSAPAGFNYGPNGTTILATDGGTTAPQVTTGDGGIFVLDTSGLAGAAGTQQSMSSFTLELLTPSGGGTDSLDLVYQSTPEPGTALLVIGGVAPMLLARRRRKIARVQN